MQRKADNIGGIAKALHLKISIKKLRQIAVDFGSQALIPKPCSLDVNDGTGKIESVTIPPKGPFDQLGYKYSVGVYPVNQRPDLDQFIRLKSFLIAVCRSLKRKSATPLCKLAALEMSVFNTVLWRTQCSPWSLAMCQELDIPVNKLLKHITKNLPGFSNNLLYAKAPGLNLARVSDLMQTRKLALAQRGITNPPLIAAGPNGLIQRGARTYGLVTIPGNRMTFGSASQYHWISSLLTRLDQCSLYLTTGGHDPTGTLEEQLNSHVHQTTALRPSQVRKLTSLSSTHSETFSSNPPRHRGGPTLASLDSTSSTNSSNREYPSTEPPHCAPACAGPRSTARLSNSSVSSPSQTTVRLSCSNAGHHQMELD